MIGKSLKNEEIRSLEKESSAHGDIIQADVSDLYEHLPVKVLSGYQWLCYEWGNRSDFFAFTDDDCAVNIPITYDFLVSNREEYIANHVIYCGYHYTPPANHLGMRQMFEIGEQCEIVQNYTKV